MSVNPDFSMRTDELNLEEVIGQVLCFGWSGADADGVNDHAIELVEDMQVGGVILLGRNVSGAEQAKAAITELQYRSYIPLLVAVDQEGGRVNRFGPPLTAFPGNMALGACGELAEDYCTRQARCQASELRALGVNWNLAPVMDVNNNPRNPVIGVRSYGEEPELVARLGTAAIRGFREGGLLACAKHFPGHGNTAVDSHLGLPVVSAARESLETVELVPFRAAIAAGVPTMMTTHIVFTAVDPNTPATMSSAVLTGLLRQELGYGGLLITDCLEMAAIAETAGTAAGAVAAIAAGADMVLVSHTLDTQREVVRALRNAVSSGIIREERIREAARRVLAAKSALCDVATHSSPWLNPTHSELEMCIARSAITVVRGSGSIPIPTGARCGVASFDDAAESVAAHLNALGVKATPYQLQSQLTGAARLEAIAKLTGNETVVLLTAFGPASEGVSGGQTALVREVVKNLGDRAVLCAAQSPYDIAALPEATTAICAYGSRPCCLRALAEVLAGRVEARGRLPVTVASS